MLNFLLTEIFKRRMDVLDEFTVLFPRSFPLIQSVTQAAKKILPGSVHTLIVRHAVTRTVRKSTKFCFIFISKLRHERSITHVSSIRSHFHVKFRPCILYQFAVGSGLFGHCHDCMAKDQSVNRSWKNLFGGVCDTLN